MLRIDHGIVNVHAKGGCYVCNANNNLVDLEVTVDYEGVLALCRGCVHDAAITAGYALADPDAPDVAALEAQLAEAEYITGSILAATDAVTAALSEMRSKHGARLRAFRSRLAKKSDA